MYKIKWDIFFFYCQNVVWLKRKPTGSCLPAGCLDFGAFGEFSTLASKSGASGGFAVFCWALLPVLAVPYNQNKMIRHIHDSSNGGTFMMNRGKSSFVHDDKMYTIFCRQKKNQLILTYKCITFIFSKIDTKDYYFRPLTNFDREILTSQGKTLTNLMLTVAANGCLTPGISTLYSYIVIKRGQGVSWFLTFPLSYFLFPLHTLNSFSFYLKTKF